MNKKTILNNKQANQRLRDLLKQVGINHFDLHRFAAIPPQQGLAFLKGQDLRDEEIIKMAKSFEINLEYLNGTSVNLFTNLDTNEAYQAIIKARPSRLAYHVRQKNRENKR